MFGISAQICFIALISCVCGKQLSEYDINFQFRSMFNQSDTNFLDNFRSLQSVYTKISNNLSPIETKLKESAFGFLRSVNVSDKCQDSLFRWFQALTKNQYWAFKFFDAIEGIPSGLSDGVITSFGEYDLCLRIREQTNDGVRAEGEAAIRGRYCSLRPYLPLQNASAAEILRQLQERITILDMSFVEPLVTKYINLLKIVLTLNQVSKEFHIFHYGVCIPSQCDAQDVQKLLDSVVKPLVQIPFDVECDQQEISWNSFNTLVLIIPLIAVTLVLISTLIPRFNSISLAESNRHLFRVTKEKPTIVKLMNIGVCFWFFGSFHYGFIIASGLYSYKEIFSSFILDAAAHPNYFWLRSHFQRSSLFFLSGIFISFVYFTKDMKHVNAKSCLRMIIAKWVRYLPKMVGLILVLQILLMVGDGPGFGQFARMGSCGRNFWKNLIFANNFDEDTSELCVITSGMLSLVVQLHVISPIFIISLKMLPKVGICFNLFVAMVFAVIKVLPRFMSGYYILPFEIANIDDVDTLKHSFTHYFSFTEQFVNLFIIGITVGYYMKKENRLFAVIEGMNKTLAVLIGVVISALSLLWSMCFRDMDQPMNKPHLVVFYMLGDMFWVTGLSVILVALKSNKCNVMLKTLSRSQLFSAFHRLLLVAVLNFSIVPFNIFTRREIVAISHFSQLKYIYIDLTLCFIASYLSFVFLEYPVIKLWAAFKKAQNRVNEAFDRKKSIDFNNNDRDNNKQELRKSFIQHQSDSDDTITDLPQVYVDPVVRILPPLKRRKSVIIDEPIV